MCEPGHRFGRTICLGRPPLLAFSKQSRRGMIIDSASQSCILCDAESYAAAGVPSSTAIHDVACHSNDHRLRGGVLGPFWTLFLALPLSAVWVLIAGLSTVWFVQLVRQRAWQRSILALIPPAAMLLDPQALISVPMHVGDVIHFVREKPSYDRQVAALARNGSRFGEFNWGGMLFGSSGVVFDETDEMSLPKARRSAAWQARMKDTDLMCGGTDVGGISPLWAHYYLAGFGC